MKIIGIDAGGTKTYFSLYSEKGEELKSIELDSIHILQKEEEYIIKILKEGIEFLKSKTEDYYIIIGTAGYGHNEKLKKKIENVYNKAIKDDYRIYSDIELAYFSSLENKDGILLISGTGSIALAKIRDKFYRVGGYGPLISDEGSAYYIGQKVLNEFTKQMDNRKEKNELYYAIKEKFNIKSDKEILLELTNSNDKRKYISSFAPFAKYSLKIYDEAIDELILHIITLKKYFENETVEVRCVGGVFKEEYIISKLREKIENINIYKSDRNPTYGAYVIYKMLNK